MCGIAGLINTGTPEILERMRCVQQHRGPDSQGIEWFSQWNAGFAHARLAIIDLSPAGHQPMRSADGRYWIVFNGEVYNYRELRTELESVGHQFVSQSDTEIILAAYVTWGEVALAKFNGMFALAIFDTLTGDLFAARDQVGIKPFYYWQGNGGLAFASEIKGLLQHPGIPREPDLDAICTPARFQISPQTGFLHIHKLPPGHWLKFCNGQLEIKRYWRITPREDGPVSRDELEALLSDAVRLQMISDRPVGAFLSGGLDSSIISALMRKQSSADLHAFTIKFAAEDQKFEANEDDSVWARRVADTLGFKFHEFELAPDIVSLLGKMVWHLDEPLSDPAAINTYLISQAARDMGIIVLLNGVGGDEIFGGYRKHLACLKASTYQKIAPGFVRRSIASLFNHLPVATSRGGLKKLRWAKRFVGFAELPEVERYLSSDLSLAPDAYEALFAGRNYRDTHFWKSQQEALDRSDVSYLTRMCLNDTQVFLPEHNLTYADKAAMAASIETRPPLTDVRLVERMFSAPPEQRIRGNIQKALLKDVSERHLDKAVVHRPKAPFNSPLRSWMRGPLAPLVDEMLSETNLAKRGIYHVKEVRRLIQADRSGSEDHALRIWTFLTTELWFRTFFDRVPDAPITF